MDNIKTIAKSFANTATKTGSKMIFKAKKHSPEILLVAGAVGIVAGVVAACKATIKVPEIIEERNAELEKARNISNPDNNERIENARKKEITKIYFKYASKIARKYILAALIIAFGMTAMISSNGILRKRNLSLTSALAVVTKELEERERRTIERFGEEVNNEIKYGIKKEIKEIETTDENGKKKKEKVEVYTSDRKNMNEFCRCFDETSAAWVRDPELNMMFLRAKESMFTDILHAKGYLFLNDVYEGLGFERTKAGQTVGWIIDPKDPSCDGYVDFGIFNIHSKANRDFVNGYEPSIWLSFNHDGNILERIKVCDI